MATLTLAKNSTDKAAGDGAGAAPATAVPADPSASAATAAPKKAFVVAVHGNMLHLFTNVWFTTDPKKVELDDFVRCQIDAGKLRVVEP